MGGRGAAGRDYVMSEGGGGGVNQNRGGEMEVRCAQIPNVEGRADRVR